MEICTLGDTSLPNPQARTQTTCLWRSFCEFTNLLLGFCGLQANKAQTRRHWDDLSPASVYHPYNMSPEYQIN